MEFTSCEDFSQIDSNIFHRYFSNWTLYFRCEIEEYVTRSLESANSTDECYRAGTDNQTTRIWLVACGHKLSMLKSHVKRVIFVHKSCPFCVCSGQHKNLSWQCLIFISPHHSAANWAALHALDPDLGHNCPQAKDNPAWDLSDKGRIKCDGLKV